MAEKWDLVVDVGSENIRTMAAHWNDYTDEPSCAAYRRDRTIPFMYGQRAADLIGRTPESIFLRRPLCGGAIEDEALLTLWISQLIQVARIPALKRPKLLMACPPELAPSERVHLMRCAVDAGIGTVGLTRSDRAAALGAGVDILKPMGHLIVEIGAQRMTASVLAGGHVARFSALPYGMARVHEAVQETLRAHYHCAVGPETARVITHELAAASGVTGRLKRETAVFDLTSQRPCTKIIEAEPIIACVNDGVEALIRLCLRTISHLPPALAGDLTQNGMVITGGGARLYGLDRRLQAQTGLPCRMADQPEGCVIRGLMRMRAEPETFDAIPMNVMDAVKRP